jgi:hypothetical protein
VFHFDGVSLAAKIPRKKAKEEEFSIGDSLFLMHGEQRVHDVPPAVKKFHKHQLKRNFTNKGSGEREFLRLMICPPITISTADKPIHP